MGPNLARDESCGARLRTVLSAIKDSMETRFQQYLTDDNTILSTFLDARYKNNFFPVIGNQSPEITLADIRRGLAAYQMHDLAQRRDSSSLSDQTPDTSPDRPEDTTTTEFTFEQCYGEPVIPHEGPTSHQSSFDHIPDIGPDIDLYMAMPTQERNGSPLEWWRKNGHSLLSLKLMASKFLSAPPSSIESERLFSIGGNIYSPHRNRILPDAGERLMFLNYNLRMMDYKY